MNIKKIAQEALTEKFNFGDEPVDHLTEEIETVIILTVNKAMENAHDERIKKAAKADTPSEYRKRMKPNIHIKPRHIPDISDILKVHIND